MKVVNSLWWASLSLKILLACFLPFFHDEAYYWVWGHNLQLSYYDHPPFVAWLFATGQLFDNFYYASRLPGVVLSHLTLYIWILIAKDFLRPQQLLYFVFFCLLSPLIGLGSLILTPDIPLHFFWSIALYLFLIFYRNPSLKTALLFGLCVGLGFIAKYNMVLFVPFALAALFINKKWNALKPHFFFIGILGFVIGSLPVILWNFQNEFISFKFQLNHGLGGKSWRPEWTLSYAFGQLLLVSPPVLWSLIKFRQRREPLFLFALLPMAFFFLTSFKGHVEANWPLVAYAPAFIVALSQMKMRTANIIVFIWSFIFVLAYGAVITRAFKSYDWAKKLEEPYVYDNIAKALTQIDKPAFARSYQMASQLSFKLKRPVYKLKGVNRLDFFDFLAESNPDSSEFYYIGKNTDRNPKQYLQQGYKLKETQEIDEVYSLRLFSK